MAALLGQAYKTRSSPEPRSEQARSRFDPGLAEKHRKLEQSWVSQRRRRFSQKHGIALGRCLCCDSDVSSTRLMQPMRFFYMLVMASFMLTLYCVWMYHYESNAIQRAQMAEHAAAVRHGLSSVHALDVPDSSAVHLQGAGGSGMHSFGGGTRL